MIDKRKNPSPTEQELYELNPLDDFIKKERRKDELSRLNEVRQQRKVWRNIMLFCGLINLVLIVFAIMGYMNNV